MSQSSTVRSDPVPRRNYFMSRVWESFQENDNVPNLPMTMASLARRRKPALLKKASTLLAKKWGIRTRKKCENVNARMSILFTYEVPVSLQVK